jgi:NADH dehydrogenase (ubiquinone) Fe-S protein 7
VSARRDEVASSPSANATPPRAPATMHGSDNVDMQLSKRGSNQLSLETPQNGAGVCMRAVEGRLVLMLRGALSEYVLSTLDKITNWARQSSMWPMTFGLPSPSLLFRAVPHTHGAYQVSPAVR